MAQQALDEGAFAAFCHAQYARLVGALTLYTGDRELAHDLVQETYTRLWRDRYRLADVASLEAYAYRTAINLAKNHFRWRAVRQRYRDRVASDVPEVHHDPDTPDGVAVREAVGSLPDRKRAALVLRYFADQSVSQTAQVMAVPEGTVKTLTRRALAQLRETLDLADEEVHDG